MLQVAFKADVALAAIRRAIRLMDDMTPIYADIAEYMVGATKDRFETGTAPDGRKWAPKSQTTIDRYRRSKEGRSAGIKPLIGPSRRLGNEIFRFSSRDGALIGSNLIYSGVMQRGAAQGAFGRTARGGPIPWGRIPARAWLGLSRSDEKEIVDIVEEKLGGMLQG